MLRNEKLSVRIPAEMKDQLEQVADRYGLTLSNAVLFVLSCGLDTEKDYRPALRVANAVTGFCRRLKGGAEDAETSTNQE